MATNEHGEQTAVMEWAAWNQAKCPALARLFAIPNGGQRHKAVAAKLKAEGVRPGVPDLFLPVARKGFHGLFIEMKTLQGRLTPTQGDWAEFLTQEGYLVHACFGADKAIQVLKFYLDLK